jgi:hypothetical protein
VWNALFDAGTATGALGLGVVAAALGLPGSYLLVCAALLLVLPAAVVSTRRPPDAPMTRQAVTGGDSRRR